MIPQVDLSRVTPVVVVPFGESSVKFATDISSRFLRESIGASIDRRALPLGERIRTLHESGGRVFFCGVGGRGGAPADGQGQGRRRPHR